jgi:peptide deformylase
MKRIIDLKSFDEFISESAAVQHLKFYVDMDGVLADFDGEIGFKKVFINAHILELNGASWSCDEGCLSLPGFREEVSRESEVVLEYCDESFNKKVESFKGLNARVILHEYDHIDGKLFIDHISLIKKKLLKKKLDDISAGRVKPGYKMLFAK